jgi:hypothetical protein
MKCVCSIPSNEDSNEWIGHAIEQERKLQLKKMCHLSALTSLPADETPESFSELEPCLPEEACEVTNGSPRTIQSEETVTMVLLSAHWCATPDLWSV